MNIGFQNASDHRPSNYTTPGRKTLMPISFGAGPWQMDLLDRPVSAHEMILTGSAFCTPVDLPARRILAPKMAHVPRAECGLDNAFTYTGESIHL
ncbi:MAG: hypothetical protein M1826_002231 [Phylliscum demangeonii]|nr:MAG: hypothetical protein M1826_002231 [Phylliscum demangeonii]